MSGTKAHQEELDRAFAWVRHVYEQAWSLRNAAEAVLRDQHFVKVDSIWRNEQQPASWLRCVYLDLDWYSSQQPTTDTLLVLALDYASVHRVGCHLHLAACTVSDHVKRLRPQRASLGEMLNLAVRLRGYEGGFEIATGSDGLTDATPVAKIEPVYQRFVGDFKVRSASFPVAWVSSHERLTEILLAGVRLVNEADGRPLAALAQRAASDDD